MGGTDESKAPMEGKVSAQIQGNAAGMALLGFLIWLLGVTVFDQPADAGHAMQAAAAVPAPVIGMMALLPVGLGGICGYMAKHTPRPASAELVGQLRALREAAAGAVMAVETHEIATADSTQAPYMGGGQPPSHHSEPTGAEIQPV